MRIRQATTPIVLQEALRVTLRSKEHCVDDPLLAQFDAGDGAAASEVESIVQNLLSGEALPQTVALLVGRESGTMFGIASIRIEGNQQIRAKQSTPWFLRRLAGNPYVNVVARDVRYRNYLLADAQTRLGTVLVRSALEMVEHELPPAPLPTVWALIRRRNTPSKRAFRQLAFYPHDRSSENQQDVFVRRAGRRLPPAPDASAYMGLQSLHAAERHLTA
jgi:hypothetical protein